MSPAISRSILPAITQIRAIVLLLVRASPT
jgi:hypothetical protein